MILRAEPCGHPNFRRWVIQNINNEKFYNGEGFTEDFKKASKYCHSSDACKDMGVVLKKFYGNLEKRTFTVPMEVEVYGSAALEDIAKYLYQASVLNIKTDEHGNGPIGNLVLPKIYWGKLKELIESMEDTKKLESDSDQYPDFDDM